MADDSTTDVPPWRAPRLLVDAPAISDEFGGGHARVAGAVAELVQAEAGGRALALTGPYGSGKSTVVRLVEEALKGTGSAVFTFDAWAHSGDPLRRSFIEELVAFLSTKKWTTQKEWREELGKLSRKIDITDETSGPRLTAGGVLFGLSALLLPLGFALFSRHGVANRWGMVGLVLSLLPFVVVFLSAFASLFGKREGAADHVFALLVRDKHSRTRSTTVRTPDPTTVEFRKVFRDIASRALAPDGRTLVVVVDNLDRLPPDEAVAAWGAMRTFFDRGAGAPSPWETRFWLIAPFDTVALERSWDRALGEEREGTDSRSIDELVSKTFGVVLNVPPPVLSDWKTYFLARMTDAFPYWAEHHDDELYASYRLFLTERDAGEPPPTPRQIIVFANRLAALDRQRRGDIPLRVLVYYLLIERRLGRRAGGLRGDDLVSVSAAAILGTNWRRRLAAVHFNVPTEKALQILIGSEVAAALVAGDGTQLDELRDVAGLDEVLLENIESISGSGSLAELALAARALALANIDDGPSLRAAWRAFTGRVAPLPPLKDLSSPVAEGIAHLIQRADRHGQSQLASQVAVSVVDRLSLAIGSDGEADYGITTDTWLASIGPVVRALRNSSARDRLASLTVTATPETYITLVGAVDDDLISDLPPSVDPEEIVTALVASVEEGAFTPRHVRAVRRLGRVRKAGAKAIKWDFKALTAAIQLRLEPPFSPELDPGETSALTECLIALRLGSGAADARKSLLADGSFYHHFAQTPTDSASSATLALSILWADPDLPESVASGDAVAGRASLISLLADEERADEFAQLVAPFVETYLMWALLGATPAMGSVSSFIDRVIRCVEVSDHALDVITIEELSKAPRLHQALGEEFEGLVRKHIDRGGFVARIKGDIGVTSISPTLHHAIEHVASEDLRAEYREYVRDKLDTIESEAWAKHLQGGTDVVWLATTIAMSGGARFGVSIAEGFRTFATAQASEGAEPATRPERAAEALGALTQDAADTLFRNLRDDIIRQGLPALTALNPVFGDSLQSRGHWEEKSDDVVRGLFADIVREGNSSILQWLDGLFSENVEVLRQSERSSRVALLDLIEKRQRAKTPSDVRSILDRLYVHVRKRVKFKKSIGKRVSDAVGAFLGDDKPGGRVD
ncbi:P-loop NTPase fold protein [Rubrivirga sp. IMCC43871]|uniref:P-loop NTPase fold protein n=1 Tax=Rubrivirga sp. IMCC43871 TaxID=3391575 RepID=UPI00398FFDA6